MSVKPSEIESLNYIQWLHPVEDPELFVSIVDLGLVYDAGVDDAGKALVKMTLTSPGCPAGDYLIDEVKKRMREHESVKDVDVEIVWEPKWDPKTMASDEVKDRLGIW